MSRGHRLYALAQGVFPAGQPGGTPAAPNTGQLLKVNDRGAFTVIAAGLNRPSSLESRRNAAYVVTLRGEILKITN